MLYKTKKRRELGMVACALIFMIGVIALGYLGYIFNYKGGPDLPPQFVYWGCAVLLIMITAAAMLMYSNFRESAEEVAQREEEKRKSDAQKAIWYAGNWLLISIRDSLIFCARNTVRRVLYSKWNIFTSDHMESVMHEIKLQLTQAPDGGAVYSREIYELKRIVLITLKHLSICAEDLYSAGDKKKGRVASLLQDSGDDAMSIKDFRLRAEEQSKAAADASQAHTYFRAVILHANALGLNIYDPQALSHPYSYYRKLRVGRRSFLNLPADKISVEEMEEQLYS